MSILNSSIPNDIGKRIKQLRTDKKLTQRDFAKALSTSAGYICDIEAGRSKPGYEILYSIYRTYKISLYWLIAGEGQMEGKEQNEKAITIEDEPREDLLSWVKYFWEHADRYERGWLIVEMKRKFSEFDEWIKKKGKNISTEP